MRRGFKRGAGRGYSPTKRKKRESVLSNGNLIRNSKDRFTDQPAAHAAEGDSGVWRGRRVRPELHEALPSRAPAAGTLQGSPARRRVGRRCGIFRSLLEAESHTAFSSQLPQLFPEDMGAHGVPSATAGQ